MNETAGRVFASHYQLVICDDPTRVIANEHNWNETRTGLGFAGHRSFRMVATEALLNDHWVELVLSDRPPVLDDWDRVTCMDFVSETGRVHVTSVVADEPALSLEIPSGEYSLFVAGKNLGVDQHSLGEATELSDDEIARRRDLEWYRIFIVPGSPVRVGRFDTRYDGYPVHGWEPGPRADACGCA